MGAKLYVGNLSYSVTEERLQQHFAQHGSVVSARIITDKFSGRSKGFGFVEMGSESRSGESDERAQRHRLRRAQHRGQRSAPAGAASERRGGIPPRRAAAAARPRSLLAGAQ